MSSVTKQQHSDFMEHHTNTIKYLMQAPNPDIQYLLEEVRAIINALYEYQDPEAPPLPFKDLERDRFETGFSYSYRSIESTLILLRLLPNIIENKEWEKQETRWSTSVQPHPTEGNIVTVIDSQTRFTVHAYNPITGYLIRINGYPDYDQIKISVFAPNGTDPEKVYTYLSELFFEPDPFEGKIIRISDEGISVVHLDEQENLAPYEPEVERAVAWMTSITNKETVNKLHKLSLPARAGLLLEGPPGSGKTTLVRRIAKQLEGDVTILYPNANVPMGLIANEIQKFDTVLVILEDVESFFGERGNEEFSDFLNVVDGLKTDNTIMFLATTNDSSGFDPAVRRPGRLERSVAITHVFQDALTDIVSQRLPECNTQEIIEALRSKYKDEELTMATVDYLARSVIMEDIQPDDVSEYILEKWVVETEGHDYVNEQKFKGRRRRG